MSKEEQSSLVQLLNQSSDVFAWTPREMLGVDPKVISQKLGMDSKETSVMQKQRKLAPECRATISC